MFRDHKPICRYLTCTRSPVDPIHAGHLWKILVLGTIRLNCNWDFDKVHDIANNHNVIREFMGHTVFECDQRYGLQTIKDVVSAVKKKKLKPGG
jgi:hypothetical protein